MKGDDFSSALSFWFFGEIPNSHPNQWVTYKSRCPLQLKTHHYPKICGFLGGENGLQRWWIQTLFGWIEGWPAHGKWVWLNKKCCWEVLRLREDHYEITPKDFLFLQKKAWKSRRLRNSWKFSEWKTGSFTLNHFPFDAQGEMGTFRLIYKENRDSVAVAKMVIGDGGPISTSKSTLFFYVLSSD